MSVAVSQPSASIPRGRSAGGPTSVTRAPISTSACTFERATREWRTSPTIATCRPSMRPSSSWIVYRSRSACVGCWCLPSPAFTTLAFVKRATRCGAPICGWRMTMTSGSYAPIVRAVSFSDSPLSTEEPAALIDIVSAESRFTASSKLDDVRVDALLARGREVLADVVGADRQLAVAAVDEHGELHARGPAVVEEGVDRGPDRAPRVEHVVDEDDRAALERELELRGADDRLRVERRLAAAHLDVVAVEGDVDRAERGRDPGALLDQPPQALRERHAAGVDADERDVVEVGVPFDDLVGDPGERPVEGGLVEEDLPGGAGRQRHSTP